MIFGSVRIVYTTPLPGAATEMIDVDLNGDGFFDIITARFYYPLQNVSIPIEILLNNGDGTFRNGTAELISGTVPATVHPRETIAADFNDDGRPDFFWADHGYDALPFPGYQNQLLLSSGATGYVNATATSLPQITDFSHSATAADIDGDGDLDIFVGNVYGQGQVGPYFLINNGLGVFTRSNTRIPTNLADLSQNRDTTTLLADFDNDGDVDLFLGGDDTSNSTLLRNNGTGNFVAVAPVFPAEPYSISGNALDSQAIDLNGDGLLDLVVTYSQADYQNRSVEIFINQGGFSFLDVTAQRLDFVSPTGVWVKYIQFADFNGDGALDFITEPAYGASEILLNNGDGEFFRPEDCVQNFTGGSFEVTDYNNDGHPDILAWGNENLIAFQWEAAPTYSFTGTDADNAIYGDAAGNFLSALGGNDTVRAGAGNDTVYGGAGNDAIYGGTGDDTLDGGVGADSLYGGNGNDTLVWDGNDTLANVLGGAGTDTLLVLNGPAPTTFGLTAHEFEGAQVRTTNNASYTSRTDTYNANWQLLQQDTANLDGSSLSTLLDPTGVQTWSQVNTYANAAGQTYLQSVLFDDNSAQTNSFDPTNIQTWTSAVTYYDTQLRTTLNSVAYDDGTSRATYYDPSNVQTWTSADTFYNTAGATTLQSVANDNGTSQVQYWDTTNVQNWSTAILYYNASGQLTRTTGVYDAGGTFSF